MLFEYYPEEILSYVLLNFSNPTFLLAAITFILIKSYKLEGLPVAQMVKNLPANAGDQNLIPESGKAPGEGNGYPLQYSCLENSMDRGALWTAAHWVAKHQTGLND